MTSASDEKWRPFKCVFSVQGTGGNATGPDPENRVGNQDTGSPGRSVSSGLQLPGVPGQSCKNKTPLVTFPRCFSFKISFNYTSRRVILRVDSLTLLKIINVEDAVLIPKHRGDYFSSGFCIRKFLGWGEPLCRQSIDCCFVSGSY